MKLSEALLIAIEVLDTEPACLGYSDAVKILRTPRGLAKAGRISVYNPPHAVDHCLDTTGEPVPEHSPFD